MRRFPYPKAGLNQELDFWEKQGKPVLSPNFTIEDIDKLREYNYEMTKDMTGQERMDYYNEAGITEGTG